MIEGVSVSIFVSRGVKGNLANDQNFWKSRAHIFLIFFESRKRNFQKKMYLCKVKPTSDLFLHPKTPLLQDPCVPKINENFSLKLSEIESRKRIFSSHPKKSRVEREMKI